MQKYKKEAGIYLVLTVVMAVIIIIGSNISVEYNHTNLQGITYVKGKVVKIVSEDIEENNEGIKKGVQNLKVDILQGVRKGETIEVTNQLSVTHSIYVKEGQTAVICIDQPEEEYYLATVYNYNRTPAIIMIALLFILTLILVGGFNGVRTVFGLAFTFVTLIFVLIPLITKGANPVLSTVVVIIPITIVYLVTLTGISKKTFVSILGTSSGILVCYILFWVFGKMLNVSGYNTEQVETLVVIAQNIKLHIKDLLFVGVLISSLGAVMDISVSVSSSMCEIKELNPSITSGQLFKSGISIGKDIIGTMANTLILAFTGAFFVTLFLFKIYSVEFNQFMNMDSIAIEIGQAIAGTMAVTLTVPFTSYISSLVYSKGRAIKSGIT